MKKALLLASVASMIDQFNMPNIKLLLSSGYKVDVIADFTNPGNITEERAKILKKQLSDLGVRVYNIGIPRSINILKIISAYRNIKEVICEGKYDILHCHSPIGGVVARIAARKKRKEGMKVVYFYKNAPLKNWILYYPVEKILSGCTDILITINKEDYILAKNKFKADKILYIPGIGIDLDKYKPCDDGKKRIRKELDVKNDRIVLLSVGELNENKNHENVIKAISGLNLTYVVVGKGELKEKLTKLAKQYNVDLRLMGYRNDVADFYNAADIYILPSKREGLNVSLMEAMACGKACAVSDIRGNNDLIDKKGGLKFKPYKLISIRKAVIKMLHMDICDMGNHNKKVIQKFSLRKIEAYMKNVYSI